MDDDDVTREVRQELKIHYEYSTGTSSRGRMLEHIQLDI